MINRIINKEKIRIYTDQSEIAIETENILGYLEGSTFPEEVIIITAHYDHLGVKNGRIFNGADDNASGTTALLEIAEAFSQAVGWRNC